MAKLSYDFINQIKDNLDGRPLLKCGDYTVTNSEDASDREISEYNDPENPKDIADGKVYVNEAIDFSGVVNRFQGFTEAGDPVFSFKLGGANACYVMSDSNLLDQTVAVEIGGVFTFTKS